MTDPTPSDSPPPENDPQDDGKLNKTLATGLAFGIGSAAIVAALLYANRKKKQER
jgi:hypothetical protein